jgi:GTP-binding protein
MLTASPFLVLLFIALSITSSFRPPTKMISSRIPIIDRESLLHDDNLSRRTRNVKFPLRLRRRDLQDEANAVIASQLPTIAIVGRPNTGKSTIVNRICDDYIGGSIVHDDPGVTRDRVYRNAVWNGYHFRVVDTGGMVFDEKSEDIFADEITYQAQIAFAEAVAAIFVCDGIAGVTRLDQDVSKWLRKRQNDIPIYVAVNKCESITKGVEQAAPFVRLGLGHPFPVSGIHGIGIGDILDLITAHHMRKITVVIPENVTNVALIGRPNVGKSSLFNKLCGENRSIVSDVPGTTRDAIDSIITRGNETFRIVDTAGVRKKNRIDYGTEFFMINRSNRALLAIKSTHFVICYSI